MFVSVQPGCILARVFVTSVPLAGSPEGRLPGRERARGAAGRGRVRGDGLDLVGGRGVHAEHVNLVRGDLSAVDDAELIAADAELHLGIRGDAGRPADVAGERHPRVRFDLEARQRERAERPAAAGTGRAAARARAAPPAGHASRTARAAAPLRRAAAAGPGDAGRARGAAAGAGRRRRRCPRSRSSHRCRPRRRWRLPRARPPPAAAPPDPLPAAPLSIPALSLLMQPAAVASVRATIARSPLEAISRPSNISSCSDGRARIGSPVELRSRQNFTRACGSIFTGRPRDPITIGRGVLVE